MSITENSVSTYTISEPVCSSDSVWYKEDMNTSITTIIDAKAESTHTHDGYAASEHEHTGYAASDHTHDYAASTHSHSEYAASTHEHSNYTPLSLMPVSAAGDVNENLTNADVLAAIAAKPTGMYTFYAATGSTNNPTTASAYRYLCHKTSTPYGWLLAFDSNGSLFVNYLHNSTWQGWRAVYEDSAGTLWSGAKIMTSSETITPTKALSACRNGWMLEWSDYNNDSTSAANTNFVHTPVYKRNVNGNWDGKNMMFRIPNYISDDGATIGNATKQLMVHDTKLVGHVANDQNTANLDVCLRAVYEF